MCNALTKLTAVFTFMCASALAQAEVSIENPYVRAVPPGQTNTAAFMQLHNNSAADIALVSASSKAAEHVELHNHVNNDGVMQMRQVKQVNIAANQSTALQPGGYHIMLIGLTQAIAQGDNIDLKVEFSDGTQQLLTIPVQKPMSGMKDNSHGHHHH